MEKLEHLRAEAASDLNTLVLDGFSVVKFVDVVQQGEGGTHYQFYTPERGLYLVSTDVRYIALKPQLQKEDYYSHLCWRWNEGCQQRAAAALAFQVT